MVDHLFDGEGGKRNWERVGDDMDALAEIGMVREDDVRGLVGHDSVVRVDSPIEITSTSRSE
jgi:hypothetical protein